MIPYGKQHIEDDDIAAVVEVLTSDWLTTGPKVDEFERALAQQVGAPFAVAVNSGTAALHAAMFAVGVGPGDEVIVPPLTFAATANCAVFQGATPVFADVDERTMLLDSRCAEDRITPRTRAIISVDLSGHPCDYDALASLARKHGLVLVSDACHALGASYKGRAVGSLADLSTFSFHPVKHVTTGEGGMITTGRGEYAERMKDFRTHGITRDWARMRGPLAGGELQPWYYEMQALGFNYRLSDINCALGISQLRKLDRFVARRREIAAAYTTAFGNSEGLSTPVVEPWASPAWHLYIIRCDFKNLGKTRNQVVGELRERGVGTQVHYIPVHLQPFYIERFGTHAGMCPVAEEAYERMLSLPMYPGMTDSDVETVIHAVREVILR